MSRRRSTRSALMALAAAWLLLGHSRAAEACQTTTCSHSKDPACVRDPATLCWAAGEKVSWWQACTSFSLRAEGVPKLGLDYSATEALVLSAFERWTSASCGSQPPSIVVAPLGPIECSEVEYNPEGPNANAVLFRDGEWVHDANALALTTVRYQKTTGKIVDADMEVNLDHPSVTVQSLPYVVTHEAGHFLGLDHSALPSALMYAQYTPESRPGSALADDDLRSICEAYPARNAGDCNFAPAAGFDTRCGGDLTGGCSLPIARNEGAPSWLAAVALGSVAWLLGRRRRAHSR